MRIPVEGILEAAQVAKELRKANEPEQGDYASVRIEIGAKEGHEEEADEFIEALTRFVKRSVPAGVSVRVYDQDGEL